MVIAAFAFNYQAQAQIGVKLGYNFAKQTGDIAKIPGVDDAKTSMKGICVGAFFDKDIIPLLDIRVGIDYSPKGLKVGKDNTYNEMRINYLEIPIQAKLKLGPVYALGGVYGAYAMNGKNTTSLLGKKTETDIKFDDNDNTRMDFGLKFGAGVQIGLGPLHAFGQVEYSYGIANISKVDKISVHNSVLSVSIGVILGM